MVWLPLYPHLSLVGGPMAARGFESPSLQTTPVRIHWDKNPTQEHGNIPVLRLQAQR